MRVCQRSSFGKAAWSGESLGIKGWLMGSVGIGMSVYKHTHCYVRPDGVVDEGECRESEQSG